MFCHSRAAGFVLGLTTPQMNRDRKYDAAIDNQLRTISHIGLFKKELAKLSTGYRAYPDPFNKAADLSARVKTYLQVNCSMCHVADGGGNSLIELGYKTPLAKARILNEPPIHETFGIAKALLIAPGDPLRSVVYYRMSHRGEGQMPPTSTNRVDEAGAKLVSEWIKQLQPHDTAR
jgi:mono/diheme cytochrome c family protein